MTHQKYAIAYTSHMTMTALLKKHKVLAHIQSQATVNNQHSGIHGFLIFKKGIFFEYIEGDEIVCRNLVNRVKTDKRHKNMHILMHGTRSVDLFTDWRMYWEQPQHPQAIFSLSPLLSAFNVADWQMADIVEVVNCIAHQDLIVSQRLNSLIEMPTDTRSDYSPNS